MSKKFVVDLKKYDPDEELGEEFDTLEAAQKWILKMFAYGFRSAWINNERFKAQDGIVFNDEPFEVPPSSVGDQLFQALKPPTREELESILRPVVTNPATLAATGKESA
jgi:hypothetical protein